MKEGKRKTKEIVDYQRVIKCRVKITNQFYPKLPQKIQEGGFGILVAKVLEYDSTLEVPELHPIYKTITIKGDCLPEISIGKEYDIQAYHTASDFGVSYTLKFISELIDLSTPDKQRLFLEQILTPLQVENLFKTFDKPFDVIKSGDIQELTKVEGIGVKTAEKLLRKVLDAKDLALIHIELKDYDLTSREVEGLLWHYKNPKLLIKAMKENPFVLMKVVKRVGFKRCDEIAMKIGIDPMSHFRISAFIQHYLEQQAQAGNSWVYVNQLLDEIDQYFTNPYVPNEVLSKALKTLAKDIMWHNDTKDKIALKENLKLEKQIAKELLRLLSAPNRFKFDNWQERLLEQEKKQGWAYTEEQKQGIKMLLLNNVSIIQGYAGAGKTSCVAGMLAIFQEQNYKVAATALAGKAAVNISESSSVNGNQITGKTIHRLLKVVGEDGMFAHNEHSQLEEQIIILDEFSMIDAELFLALLRSIRTGSKLIMLGDLAQIESLGRGNVAYDLVESGVIPNIFLTQVHRQAQRSAIVTESIKVRSGECLCKANDEFVESRGELQDLILDVYQDRKKTLKKIISHFEKEWSEVDNIMDLLVILPMKQRGEASVYHVNNQIQQIIQGQNPFKTFYIVNQGFQNEFKIFVGDKVINNKNDYSTTSVDGTETPIFNGNLGLVKSINLNDRTMIVDFELIGEVLLHEEQINHLTLGYAITIHKCVDKNTQLFTSTGIKSLHEFNPGTRPMEHKSISIYSSVYNGFYLEQPSHFYNAGRSKCRKITTEAGYDLIATLDHRVEVLDKDGYLCSRYTQDLKVGDCVLISRKNGFFGRKKQEARFKLHSLNKTNFNAPSYIKQRHAYALALILMNGFVEETSIQLELKDQKLVNFVVDGIQGGFNIEVEVEKKREASFELKINSYELCEYIRQLFKGQVFDYFFPSHLLGLDQKITTQLLQLIFESVTFDMEKRRLVLECRSEKMADQIRMMLLNYGLLSRKVEVDGEYDLHLVDQNILNFRALIGLYTKQMKESLDDLCLLIEDKTNEEKAPYLNQVAKEIIEKYELNENFSNLKTTVSLQDFVKKYEKRLSGDMRFDYLKTIVNNFYIDVVSDLTDITTYTYSLEMPQTKKYIQNGFLASNCQGSGIKRVIIGIDYSSYSLLTKELIYTAITRAKQKCILISEAKALRHAIKKSNLKNKQTFLQQFLKEK